MPIPDPRTTLLLIVIAVALALAPLAWLHRHRGPRRQRDTEGKIDGLLLLFALFSSLAALVLAGVSAVRVQREREMLASTTPVAMQLTSCSVATRRSGGRTGGVSHELGCTARHASPAGGPHEHELTAGYPGRRASLDRWMRAHPPGTEIELRQSRQDPDRITGFAQLVPSTTTTARGAARQALLFGSLAVLLMAASRAVVAVRERRRWTRV